MSSYQSICWAFLFEEHKGTYRWLFSAVYLKKKSYIVTKNGEKGMAYNMQQKSLNIGNPTERENREHILHDAYFQFYCL